MDKRPKDSDRDGSPGVLLRRTKTLIGAGVVLTVLTGGLAQNGLARNGASSAAPSTSASASATAARGSTASTRRVDLAKPIFSDPTSITNPLFPISDLAQVLQLGQDADGSLRHEVTLLPKTKTIQWKV